MNTTVLQDVRQRSSTNEQLAQMFVEKLQRRRKDIGLDPFSAEEEKFAKLKYMEIKKEK